MPYDDIRFSWWDDPDDGDDDEVLDMGGDLFDDTPLEASWDEPAFIWDDEEIYLAYEGECAMCGRERPCNDEGYCSRCWQVWNS